MNRSKLTLSLLTAALLLTTAFLKSSHAFLMWKAERNDTALYVLAKVDFTAPDAASLVTPEVTKAFDESDLIVFEFQMDPELRKQDRRHIVESAMYAPGDNLMRHLPRELIAEFNAVCEKNQINNNAIVRVKPWAAGYKLNKLAAKKAGVTQADFLDHHLFKRAGGSGKAVDYLTKPEEAIALFNNVPANTQVDMFKKLLSDAQTKQDMIRQATEAWISGNADAAASLIDESFKSYPGLQEAVSAKFSENWASKLNAMTKYDDKIMAVVPLSNVVGSGNILDQLTTEGFTISQVSAE